jgi:DNA-directed RNA polymerase subunit M/transcription elongation factor TFIIS
MLPILQMSDTAATIMGIAGVIFFIIWIAAQFVKADDKAKAEKYVRDREKELDEQRYHESKEVQESSLWKADVRVSEMLDKVSDEIFICDKCKSDRFRVWNLTDTYLQVRCLGCKKNHGYELSPLEKIKDFHRLYNDYVKLDNFSYNNYLPAIIDIYDSSLESKSNFETYRQIFIQGRRSLDDKKVSSDEKRSRRITQEVKDKVWRRDEGKCVECGSNENLEFDHIIPLSKGGANTYRNIQLLCEPCNRKKLDKIG